MSEKEKMVIPGHSPATIVGGMRVGKPHHPVGLTEEKAHEKHPKKKNITSLSLSFLPTEPTKENEEWVNNDLFLLFFDETNWLVTVEVRAELTNS